jgi:tetratricopeptide (TPR) repeat protein
MTLPPWRTCSVFVSSTFEDMHAERDHLQQVVFPALAEWLRERRVNLETTDLRWGVETMSIAEQEAKELAVLKVCMAEIDRSRPFMIVLLGDRYGWIPPAERLQRAAREAGFEIDDSPRSVTALEIEYGLRRADPQMRPRFYLRAPLPYAKLAPEAARRYSDGAAASQADDRLARLKESLRETHPGRVRSYGTGWDEEHQRPSGLEAFGAQVLEDLEVDIEAELGHASAAAVDAETMALDAFIEDRARDAVDRAAMVDDLGGRALQEDGSPYTVLVAAPGAGKSVTFAQVARRLVAHPDLLLLVHAAGVTPASLGVGSMLQRWCRQLQAALGTPEAASPQSGEPLRRAFAALLAQAAATRRVVLLVDALDQFERTPEARHLTWLPVEWPSNARVLSTANEGTEQGALTARGAAQVALAPLTPAETTAIAARLCAHWHKVMPRAVDDALLARPEAASNPLWLSLAVSELLLLDADDYTSARVGEGTPEQRLLRLLVDTVRRLPQGLPGAYGAVFERVEQAHGQAIVSAVLRRLALTRFGLRESDLQAMFTSHPAWTATTLATLRRALRAHVAERGPARQWTFTHQQAREAALGRYAAHPQERRAEEAAIGRHLRALPEGDPLRHEILHHLAEAGPVAEVRDYWRVAAPGDELRAAFEVLRQRVLGPEGETALGLAEALLGRGDGDTEELLGYLAGQRLLEFSEVVRLAEVAPARAAKLLAAIDAATCSRRDGMSAEVRYRALQNLGLLQLNQGDAENAARTLTEAGDINARNVEGRRRALDDEVPADPKLRQARTLLYHQALRDRMLNLQRLSGVQRSTGNSAAARGALDEALEIARHFVATYPKSRLGATDLAGTSYLLADLLFEQGDDDAALSSWKGGLDAVDAVQGDADAEVMRLRINGHRGMARGLARRLQVREALRHRAQAMRLADEETTRDPGDVDLRWQFLTTAEEAADTLALAGAAAAALRCWDRSLAVCAAMVHAKMIDARLVRQLARVHRRRALALELVGDDAGAAEAAAEAARYATLLERPG